MMAVVGNNEYIPMFRQELKSGKDDDELSRE